VFTAGKGFGKITVQSDSGEVMVDVVGNKGNKKTKVHLYIPWQEIVALKKCKESKRFCNPERQPVCGTTKAEKC
jgi:hypothetical protein